MKGESRIILYINGEKLSEKVVKKYNLKAGKASPFSSQVVTSSPKEQGKIKLEALKEEPLA